VNVDHAISEPTFFLEPELQAGSGGKCLEAVAYNDGCDKTIALTSNIRSSRERLVETAFRVLW